MFHSISPARDEPCNLSCDSIHLNQPSCMKSIGTKDEWKNLTPALASDLTTVCELTLQLWQWFSPFFPGEMIISPVGISWILSSIIVPFSSCSRPWSWSDSVLICVVYLSTSKEKDSNPSSPLDRHQILRSWRERILSGDKQYLKSNNVAVQDFSSQQKTRRMWSFLPHTLGKNQRRHWLEGSSACVEIWSWRVTCCRVESHSEPSFPSLQPEDVTTLVEGSLGGYGAQPDSRWMSHAEDVRVWFDGVLSVWGITHVSIKQISKLKRTIS